MIRSAQIIGLQPIFGTPDDAFMSEAFDIFTLDATVIGTALGQLIDEGKMTPARSPTFRLLLPDS